MKQGTKSDRNKKILQRVLNGETITTVAADNKLSYNRTRVIVYQCVRRILDIRKREMRGTLLKRIRWQKDGIIQLMNDE